MPPVSSSLDERIDDGQDRRERDRPDRDGRDRFLTCGSYRVGDGRVDHRPDGGVGVRAELRVEFEVRMVWSVFDPACLDLAELYRPFGRCVAVIDQNVHLLHGAAITAYFAAHQIDLVPLVCRAAEDDKSMDTVRRLVGALGQHGHNVARDEPVLVVGGGVLSDVAGLACALLNRRTPYVMVATSLVAAIDAGPSPRTCINFDGVKNGVGAYHPPVVTLVDRALLATLTAKDVRHGLAEVLKMAVVDDAELFDLLEDGDDLVASRLASPPGTPQAARQDAIISRTLRSYLRHEGPNMWEVYQDRPHAYGHTWSPAFEPLARLMHGHAVSIDMAFSATLAAQLGWIGTDARDRILDLCTRLGLAIYHPILNRPGLLADAQQAIRAKRGGRGLWAPLPRPGIGGCDYLDDLSTEALARALKTHTDLCAARTGSGGIDPHLD